jgi:hypothetical protein
MFPGDPEGDAGEVINCRCVSEPYIDDWDKAIADIPVQEGGDGSGNFGHSGRPGDVGGSDTAAGGEAVQSTTGFGERNKEYITSLGVSEQATTKE